MRERKSKLTQMTSKQIEEITEKAERRKNVPLIASKQVNMRLDKDTLDRAKQLSSAQKVPYTTFLTRLLREDIDRLWKVFKKTG